MQEVLFEMKNICSDVKLGGQRSRKLDILIFFASILIISLSIIRFRNGEINYISSDATWHTLYTLECYDETAVSVHKFLPIVTMGDEKDKWISWGACVPDKNGNYYYTSFSAGGYIFPYIFMKVFRLDFTEKSLYIWNTVLFIISCSIFIVFLVELFEENKYKYLIAGLGSIVYVMNPEILHGMGIVYWSQSLMQVTLLIQIYSYWYYVSKKSKKAHIIFLFMCVLNPYIEWTGYVANIGFAISEIVTNWKEDSYKSILKSVEIGGATIVSFVIFCVHYLLNINPVAFFTALKDRFFARNFMVKIPINVLNEGYVSSFKYTWFLLLLVLLLVLVIRFKEKRIKNEYSSIILKNKYLIFVSFFPILENYIMKQHAVKYSYDRMKLIFPLVLVACDCIGYILSVANKNWLRMIIVSITVVCGVFNLRSYMRDTSYIWKTDYRVLNEKIVDSIASYKEDSVIGFDNSVRGYLNMTVKSGIYEWTSIDSIKKIAEEKEKRYAIQLLSEENAASAWSMCSLGGAQIYDLENDEYILFLKKDGKIQKSENNNFNNEVLMK